MALQIIYYPMQIRQYLFPLSVLALRLVEWSTLKLFDEKGKQTGIITIGENITKQLDDV